MKKRLWRKTKVTDSGYKEPISGIQDLLGDEVVEVPMHPRRIFITFLPAVFIQRIYGLCCWSPHGSCP